MNYDKRLNVNFSELSNVKNTILFVLSQMKIINKSRSNFVFEIFGLFLGIKGRLNFLQFERFGKYSEQTYRNQFEEGFSFLEFNKIMVQEHASKNLAIAFDPSYISKSGKKTPGLGYFWSGVAGQAKWGLEIGGLAAVDVDNHTAFHLEAVQTTGLKENESLIEFYGRTILERKESLLEMSNILLADAYFSKTNFVNPLTKEGFTVISRLRGDADLKYLYTGLQKTGRGRPKKHDGKINIDELDQSKISKVATSENEEIYSEVVFSKSLKMNIKLVIVKTKNKGKWSCKLYFSTDVKMNWQKVLEYYGNRFQIEFLYRDAKQLTGLDDCEARSTNKLDFHFNTSLTTINLVKVSHWMNVPKSERGTFSMADAKTVYHNDLQLNRFICKFGINPNSKKNKDKIRQLTYYGCIAA